MIIGKPGVNFHYIILGQNFIPHKLWVGSNSHGGFSNGTKYDKSAWWNCEILIYFWTKWISEVLLVNSA